jgi:hypothetical protein
VEVVTRQGRRLKTKLRLSSEVAVAVVAVVLEEVEVVGTAIRRRP